MAEKLLPGDRVRPRISWKNTGTEGHTFILGCTIRHGPTNTDYDLPLETDFVGDGNLDDKKFEWWVVPSNAPKGMYAIIGAVWERESNGIPQNRLDDEVIANAFEVV